MKSWTVAELNNVCSSLQPLVGLRLQEVLTTADDVVLGFYSSRGILWLWADLNAVSPSLLPWTELPLKPENKKNPLHLFLRAHFVGKVLREVHLRLEQGRVVTLTFGEGFQLEVRLFPHGRNFMAMAGDKNVAWQKPTPVPLAADASGGVERIRSLDQLREEWMERRGKRKAGGRKPTDVKARLENELNKKNSALRKVEEELKRKKEMPWKEVGDWLKMHQSLEVSKEWEPFVDKRRKLSWNIEHCFTKAREIDGKVFGTEKRLQVLRNEIQNLEKQLAGPISQLEINKAPPKVSLSDVGAQGRTLRVSDELTAVAGKSAADNLKILRKARAWDLWFHMRDYPSSHAVLFRGKNSKVSDKVILQIADWFVRLSLGSKNEKHIGEKFALVIVECRHVKPIKGDKIGRVTYHDERVLIYKLP